MNKERIFLLSLLIIPAVLLAQDPANFSTSLHATRQGKATWYGKAQGGFENLTNIPISDLTCQKCHAATFADGTPIDPATYAPGCNDCHDFTQGTQVKQETCLGCHSRQGTEIKLSAANPIYTDVHRANGMVCTDCHTKREMHGDGTQYASMLEPGAMDVSCENDGCHPPAELVSNIAHDIHKDDVYCTACHVQTVSTCFNCHFESEVQAEKKRFYGPPPTGGFITLVRRQGSNKVTAGSFMAMAYQGKTFYALAPFTGHTISKEGRDCKECHATSTIQNYNQTGEIVMTRWNEAEKKVEFAQGVIPIPPDWQKALKFDFVNYTGDVTDPTSPFDPTKWEFLKSGADTLQMLFAEPLTPEQMDKLSMVVSVAERGTEIPKHFELLQNYPNPFNPSTVIEFHLPKSTRVTLKIFDILGGEVNTLLNNKPMAAGVYRYSFNAANLPSGIYIYKIETPEFKQTRKMTLIK